MAPADERSGYFESVSAGAGAEPEPIIPNGAEFEYPVIVGARVECVAYVPNIRQSHQTSGMGTA